MIETGINVGKTARFADDTEESFTVETAAEVT